MTEGIAAISREPGLEVEVVKIQVDDPQDNEVLVRMVATGICHSDLTLMKAGIYRPGCYGHEGSGIVEKVGKNVTKVKPGDHVVMCMIVPCGKCSACLQGKPMYCHTFDSIAPATRADGSHSIKCDCSNEGIVHGLACSFSSHLITTENAIIKVPDDVPLEILGPFACGVQTGAGAVINSLKASYGSSIAIFGLGTVGMSALMGAKYCGCKTIIAVDINPQRLALAKELGATHTINGNEEDALARILEIQESGVDYSIDTVGNSVVTRQAVECVNRHTGIAGFIGLQSFESEVTLNIFSLLNGRKIYGIVEGDAIPDLFIPMLVDLYKNGKLPIDKLVKFYDFSEIDQAIKDMEKGVTIKPILKF